MAVNLVDAGSERGTFVGEVVDFQDSSMGCH